MNFSQVAASATVGSTVSSRPAPRRRLQGDDDSDEDGEVVLVRVHAYLLIYMYECMLIYVPVSIYVCVCMVYTYTFIPIHARALLDTYTCVYTNTHVCVYTDGCNVPLFHDACIRGSRCVCILCFVSRLLMLRVHTVFRVPSRLCRGIRRRQVKSYGVVAECR